jgi:DNA-binding CsgD family transcriptional regulator
MAERLTPEVLADLIGQIYEAALSPALWPSFLENFALAMNSETAVLWSHDFASHDAHFENSQNMFSGATGFDPAFLTAYADYYSRVNVWVQCESTLPEGSAVSSSMLYPESDLPRTEYYADWLRPQRLRYAIGGIAVKRETLGVKLSALRAERRGTFDERELDFYRLLLPHIRRACTLHRRLAGRLLLGNGALNALDLLHTAIWLFDSHGEVIHGNTAADRLATRANGLWRTAGGRFAATRSTDASQLRDLVSRAVAARSSIGQPGGSMAVGGSKSSPTLHVLVCPLPPDRERLGIDAAAIAFITDVSEGQRVPDRPLVKLFGLTQAEARVAAAIVSGMTLKEYATVNGRSENTVRTQAKSLMAKVGVRRQVDLVRVLGALPRSADGEGGG